MTAEHVPFTSDILFEDTVDQNPILNNMLSGAWVSLNYANQVSSKDMIFNFLRGEKIDFEVIGIINIIKRLRDDETSRPSYNRTN